jgi:hypothetical protein
MQVAPPVPPPDIHFIEVDMISDRRASLFWAGIDKEIPDPGTLLETRILSLYGPGPRQGGKCRSDIAGLLGVEFGVVDKVIKKHRRYIRRK